MSTGPGSRSWTDAFVAVFAHEWRLIAHAPMTPVVLGGFLLTLAAAVFLAADFYASDHASADLMWTFLPWVALVFVPALAMQSFNDGPGDRGLELMLSLPLPATAIVAGKWTAGTTMLTVALAGTVPFVLTLAYLGSPDWGALVGGYLGALLLLGAFYAVALFAAALMREPVGSYVLGLLLLFAVLVAGWDVAQRMLAGTAAAPLLGAISALGPKTWLDRFASGRLEPDPLLAFGVVTTGALGGSLWFLAARRRGSLTATVEPGGLLKALVLVVAAGLIAAFAGRLPMLADLSAGRLYTLHPETIEMARSVPPGTTVDLYWSAEEARVPASIKAHARRADAILAKLAAKSAGRLTLRRHDPRPDSEAESAANAAGVRRVPMSSGDHFYLGATFGAGERQGAIPYLDVRRDQLVEYDIALALSSLGRIRTPKVGLLTPYLAPSNVKEPRPGLAMLEELKRSYDVAIIPHFADQLPDGLDVVVVIGAAILKREMLYALDQHAMRGKGLIVLIDPYARFSNAADGPVPQPSADIDDVSDLLLRYGLRFLPETIAGDMAQASPVTGGGERQISYPYWLRIRAPELSRAHAITANLGEIMLAEPGAFTFEQQGVAEAVVTTTARSGKADRKDVQSKPAEALAAAFKSDGETRVLAAVINRPLASAFDKPPAGSSEARHRARTDASAAVIAVADTDFLFDPMALQEVTEGEKSTLRPLNDNLAFLVNMIEHASGDPRLLAVRARGSQQRPFTRVASLLAAAQERHRDEEARLLGTIGRIEGDVKKVLELARVKDVSELPKPIQERIGQLVGGLQPYRRELRRIRLGMREDIERLGTRLTLLNLAAGPGFAFGFAFLMRAMRRRRSFAGVAAQ